MGSVGDELPSHDADEAPSVVIGVVGRVCRFVQGQAGLETGEDRVVAAALPDRPYEQMVAALGGYGERVEDPEQIRPALERARDSGKPACLNVILDPKLTG